MQVSKSDLTTAAPASSRAAAPPPTLRSSSTSSSPSPPTSPPRPATRARSARRAVRNPSTSMSAVVGQRGQGPVAVAASLGATAPRLGTRHRSLASPARQRLASPVAGVPFLRAARGTPSRCEVSNFEQVRIDAPRRPLRSRGRAERCSALRSQFRSSAFDVTDVVAKHPFCWGSSGGGSLYEVLKNCESTRSGGAPAFSWTR